ncbi:hypothetical protein [Pontibacter cellulosilyticus]|uniref:Uncharacterized protein n=1 Tax=Pontibacter cellulosilyticus TaxID=1720253 RepID=A0A923N8B8_9BACT|nr:hypothetical protein [Pontibacter cellulosilyticus]MBC5994054.1 hypothetical protein [Pontibacter cellulosilyticus]
MNWQNRYYKIAIIGAAITFLLQVILMFAVDPYLASVLSPLYPVWVIVFVVGWRKEHPRR